MKIKEFRKKYEEEKRLKATPQEEAMYEFCMSMKDMKKDLEFAITRYEQGKVTGEEWIQFIVISVIYAIVHITIELIKERKAKK
jgi:hypothetical protein